MAETEYISAQQSFQRQIEMSIDSGPLDVPAPWQELCCGFPEHRLGTGLCGDMGIAQLKGKARLQLGSKGRTHVKIR